MLFTVIFTVLFRKKALSKKGLFGSFSRRPPGGRRKRTLVRICETSHTIHDAQDVIVEGIDVHTARNRRAGSVVARIQLQNQSGRIQTGEITGAAWLTLFRFQCERIGIKATLRIFSGTQ